MVTPWTVLSSGVWDGSLSVLSWFCVLRLWSAVEDSVKVLTSELKSRSVPETSVGPAAAVDKRGGVDERERSEWSVLSSMTGGGGVESDVSSDVEVDCFCALLGGRVKLWVPPELVMSKSVVLLLSPPVGEALWV